jgi:hypothetical protein
MQLIADWRLVATGQPQPNSDTYNSSNQQRYWTLRQQDKETRPETKVKKQIKIGKPLRYRCKPDVELQKYRMSKDDNKYPEPTARFSGQIGEHNRIPLALKGTVFQNGSLF